MLFEAVRVISTSPVMRERDAIGQSAGVTVSMLALSPLASLAQFCRFELTPWMVDKVYETCLKANHREQHRVLECMLLLQCLSFVVYDDADNWRMLQGHRYRSPEEEIKRLSDVVHHVAMAFMVQPRRPLEKSHYFPEICIGFQYMSSIMEVEEDDGVRIGMEGDNLQGVLAWKHKVDIGENGL